MSESSSGEAAREESIDIGIRWYLYLVETASGALYTGITTDVERRFNEHQNGKRGARALRGKGPLRLVHQQSVGSRGEALKLEAWLKKQSATAKRAWLAARYEP
ncbi:GIY-YIG nuclease family protein [Halomonas sp. GXIMD04776]|uniref:GIY-YIG nuclease family protein n=1 Tax=Halomonas sp. GXIMD04776 TaxID=3415605 RepID=UPI003CAA50C5